MYEEQIPTAQLVQRVATVMQEYTQSGGVRPFGVSLLIAGWDDTGTAMTRLFSVANRTDRKSQVKQCLGFSTADFLSSLAYESAEQKPEHCLT